MRRVQRAELMMSEGRTADGTASRNHNGCRVPHVRMDRDGAPLNQRELLAAQKGDLGAIEWLITSLTPIIASHCVANEWKCDRPEQLAEIALSPYVVGERSQAKDAKVLGVAKSTYSEVWRERRPQLLTITKDFLGV